MDDTGPCYACGDDAAKRPETPEFCMCGGSGRMTWREIAEDLAERLSLAHAGAAERAKVDATKLVEVEREACAGYVETFAAVVLTSQQVGQTTELKANAYAALMVAARGLRGRAA